MVVFESNPQAFLPLNGKGDSFLLLDSNTQRHCLPLLNQPFQEMRQWVAPSGEKGKTLEGAHQIWDFLSRHNANRKAVLYVLGGGALCDLGAFCASTYMRGMRVVLIPTTLLAMVDAAVGGKTGINLGSLKNYLGTFYSAEAVWVSPRFLQTLSPAEILQGWAEVLKHSIIAGDGLWEQVKAGVPQKEEDWMPLLKNNIQLKSSVVNQDPTEQGMRKQLNLGHTLAHAIESISMESHSPVSHGEAVAAGIWMESKISENRNLATQKSSKEMQQRIAHYFKKLALGHIDEAAVLQLTKKDKKNHSGAVLMTLPQAPGAVHINVSVEDHEILAAWRAYQHDYPDT